MVYFVLYKWTCLYSGTDSSDINRCIEKFVNRTGQFPDFHDILSLVKSVQSDVNMKPENLRRIGELNSLDFMSFSC
jgi:hypothetical protein